MTKPRQSRVLAKAKPSKIPDPFKQEIAKKADALVEAHIRPRHVAPPPDDQRFNYITDIFTKWRGRYFYFMAKYTCLGLDCIRPSFDVGFARLEYTGPGSFDLAYFRHTGQWNTVSTDLSVDEALDLVISMPIFQP